MNRADRRAMGCRGGTHAVTKNVPRAGDGKVVKICAACDTVLEEPESSDAP